MSPKQLVKRKNQSIWKLIQQPDDGNDDPAYQKHFPTIERLETEDDADIDIDNDNSQNFPDGDDVDLKRSN